jgi:hypothetical protein
VGRAALQAVLLEGNVFSFIALRSCQELEPWLLLSPGAGVFFNRILGVIGSGVWLFTTLGAEWWAGFCSHTTQDLQREFEPHPLAQQALCSWGLSHCSPSIFKLVLTASQSHGEIWLQISKESQIKEKNVCPPPHPTQILAR